jgi:hypothetical protein
MSPLKKALLVFLVVMAFVATGLGGLQDFFGIKLVMSREHGWNDGIFLILVAILVALVMK